MDLYLVSRTGAWHSEEELAASADCMPAVLDTFGGDIRWVRSYVFAEPDGTFSAECLYEATSRKRLAELADALQLPPADRVRKLHAAV
ncbi:DUF4242 domain-containing protein [Solirubrobacter phytolaccae]|uniref:DUF4242 domain-containing protein n=1 Tax=Solirubrobacter phytolaccae TaxID=1404360 RepID=A0A9X3SCY0_9ACTN|nr:nickel-binding protein [Solirubrobacter phytolaccae]MDA0185211.1 DUF4242 domain-containing protein [Solirubrobacter phytolaccae]